MRRINKEDGITVISNLHLLQTAKDYCDRIIDRQYPVSALRLASASAAFSDATDTR